jgi:hypothetical protein
MLRQSASKLPFALVRSTFSRSFVSAKSPFEEQQKQNSSKGCEEENKKTEMCMEHAEMIPDADQLKNLKRFELKSSCNNFHWASEGHEHERKQDN